MSGIAGIIHFDGAPVEASQIEKMTSAMAHRGPDGIHHWVKGNVESHPLLAGLGPEPLEPGFDGDCLWERAGGRKVAIKVFVMNARVVVGVGNIYASEALFRAGIRPTAGRVSRERMAALATSIRGVLAEAVEAGGTTPLPRGLFSAERLDFAPQETGVPSAGRTVQLLNAGTAPMSIGAPQVSGPFSQANDCGGMLLPFPRAYASTAAGPAKGRLA